MSLKNKIIVLLLLCAGVAAPRDVRVFQSKHLLAADTVVIYTPKAKPAGVLPAVYLLHGWAGNYSQWEKNSDLQKYADTYNTIIICPDGFYDSWYINSPEKKGQNFADFFKLELYPTLLKQYPIDTNNVFITGLSMGGFGALSLFLDAPNRFRGAGSTSGILDIVSFPNKWGMKNIFGEFEKYPDRYLNASPLERIGRTAIGDKFIIFDCGREDFAYPVNEGFARKCSEMKLNYVFISQPGKHEHPYWKAALDIQMKYFMRLAGVALPVPEQDDDEK